MRKNAGFTLLEILVAIALASLLVSSIYGVFSTTSAAKEHVEKQGAALHLGRVLIARLDRELLGLALGAQNTLSTIKGGENSLGEPYLELLTNSTGGPQPGIRQVHYRLGPDPDNRMTIWRSEKGLNETSANPEERLAQGLEKLKFGFFDGGNWRDTWDSKINNLPILVRAEFTLEGTEGMPALLSTFDLPKK
jgi:general secretion pathway protein J